MPNPEKLGTSKSPQYNMAIDKNLIECAGEDVPPCAVKMTELLTVSTSLGHTSCLFLVIPLL